MRNRIGRGIRRGIEWKKDSEEMNGASRGIW